MILNCKIERFYTNREIWNLSSEEHREQLPLIYIKQGIIRLISRPRAFNIHPLPLRRLFQGKGEGRDGSHLICGFGQLSSHPVNVYKQGTELWEEVGLWHTWVGQTLLQTPSHPRLVLLNLHDNLLALLSTEIRRVLCWWLSQHWRSDWVRMELKVLVKTLHRPSEVHHLHCPWEPGHVTIQA